MFTKTNDLVGVGGKGEADSLVGGVEDGVVLAHEDVTQDPQRTGGLRDVHANHAEQAELTVGQQVVTCGEHVVVAVDQEGEVGEGVVVARHHVLTGDDLLAAELLGDGGHHVRGGGEDGGTRVHDGLGAGGVADAVDGQATEGDLPVSGGQKRHPGDGTGVVSGVSAAEHQLTLVLRRVTEVERELSVVDQTLGNQVVERGGHVVDGQHAEGHAEDTVELAELVGSAQANGVGHLRELLVLHDEAAEVKVVHGLVAGHGAGAVGDVEGGAVGGVGGGLGRVVLGVAAATGVAVGRSNPKVGTAGIEDHVELLVGGAEGDLAVVLGVLVIIDHDGAVLLDLELVLDALGGTSTDGSDELTVVDFLHGKLDNSGHHHDGDEREESFDTVNHVW
mmetsp:Transcript_53630/g.93578  ORF Transcript_53630/g.93578 Transcript_53630/m.93578 type:complete len:391 (-) Transcript_53630:59-1231(-)